MHGADPNGAFFTVGKPAGSGFLAERPYTGQFHIKVQKPLIQTGELTGPTKNGLRNAIVRYARKNGADAVFFDGIADNQLQNQQILFAMDNADIGYRGVVKSPKSLTLAERMGIPKGDRTNLTQDQLEGLEDLQNYLQSGRYRWRLNYNDKTGFTRTTKANVPEGSVPGVKALIDAGGKGNPVRLSTKTGN